jgi:hypothetical protein
MKLFPTWLINFGNESNLPDVKNHLIDITENFEDWLVCENIGSYVKSIDEIIPFFENEKFKNIFSDKNRQIANNEEKKKSVDLSALKIFLVGDLSDEKTRDLMNLFAVNLNVNSIKVLTGNSFLSTSSINITGLLFTEDDWKKEDKSKFSKFLFELNLLQSIPIGPAKPYNAVLFFKDINTIGPYGMILSPNQYVSKLSQIILHLGLANTDVLPKSPGYNYCTVGGCMLYFDSEELNDHVAILTADTIISKLKNETESEYWNISDKQINKYLDENLNELKPQSVFKSLAAATKSFSYTNTARKGDPNAWFNLTRLKTFFTEDVKTFITSLLYRRSVFMSTIYLNITKDVKENAKKHLEVIKQMSANPTSLMKLIFEQNLISIYSLRKSLEKYKKNIEQKQLDLKTFYQSNFIIDENGKKKEFEPFPVVGKCKEYYDEFILELDANTAEAYNEKEKKIRGLLSEKLETIPHPLSYFLRSTILSTLLVLLLYIPLNNLFNNSTFQLLIVTSILSIVFISPILLMWISYNNKIEVIAEDEAKYEALVRYIARRRVMQNIFNQMELLYKNMLSFCDDYASQIDAFCNKEIPKLDENPDKFIETDFFVNIGKNVAKKIQCKIGDFDIDTDILNEEKVFLLWKRIIKIGINKNNFELEYLLKSHDDFYIQILSIIKDEIKSTEGNILCIADLMFNENDFAVNDASWKKIQDKSLPFYSIQEAGNIDWEIKIFPHNFNPTVIKSNDNLSMLNDIQFTKPIYVEGFRSKIASFLMVRNTNDSSKLKYIFNQLDDQSIKNVISNPLDVTTKLTIEAYLKFLLQFEKEKFKEASNNSDYDIIKKEFNDWAGNSIESLILDDSPFFIEAKSKLDMLVSS